MGRSLHALGHEATFAIRVSRPGFWATHLWFFLLPLGGRDMFASWVFWVAAFYVTFPMGFLLYGWNDVVDAEADRDNPRKGTFLFGARGTTSQLHRLPVQIVMVQLPFAVVFTAVAGPKMLGWLGLVVLVNAIYNWPGWGFKNRPVLDLLNQAGYLLVFVLSSWLNEVPQLPWPGFLFGALFAMHSHLLGQIMDIDYDRRAGRVTTAGLLGVVRSKYLIAMLMIAECVVVLVFFGDRIIAAFLAAGGVWFALDAAVLLGPRRYSGLQMRLFLLAWNAVAIGSMYWIWGRAALVRLAG